MNAIDTLDCRLIDALQRDGRASNVELSAAIARELNWVKTQLGMTTAA